MCVYTIVSYVGAPPCPRDAEHCCRDWRGRRIDVWSGAKLSPRLRRFSDFAAISSGPSVSITQSRAPPETLKYVYNCVHAETHTESMFATRAGLGGGGWRTLHIISNFVVYRRLVRNIQSPPLECGTSTDISCIFFVQFVFLHVEQICAHTHVHILYCMKCVIRAGVFAVAALTHTLTHTCLNTRARKRGKCAPHRDKESESEHIKTIE